VIEILLIAGVALFIAVSVGAVLEPFANRFTVDLHDGQCLYLADGPTVEIP
jgi:hypothetical protein